MKQKRSHTVSKVAYLWAGLRIALGLIFLWAFFDKLLGLGFSTCRLESGSIDFLCKSAWVQGGSPTYGFLAFGVKGPLAGIYHALAGMAWVDWLFMIGLLGIGLALTFGILIHVASLAGSLMLFLMWTAVFPPEHHPFIDDHLVYIGVLLLLALVHAGKKIGYGKEWAHLSFVKKHPWVE